MIKTAESVSPKHPDKLCDQISDAILDACLKEDPDSRVAIETMGGHGIITVTGEMTTRAFVDVKEVVSRIVGDRYGVQANIVRQSEEIARGVDVGGAGDQGIMVGYACDETPELMPLEVMLARRLCQYIYSVHPYDGKTQITINADEYGSDRLKSIVASFQNVAKENLEEKVRDWYINYFDEGWNEKIELFCNPSGDWNIGGFEADTGLTGRKLVVDNYGPRIPLGGGCFSGKDGSKVDRSAAYMARRIAVDYLERFQAKEVYVYLAYAIGRADPVMALAVVDGKEMAINHNTYDLTPGGIIKFLDLKKPQYEETARYGHFGRGFKWDK